MTVRSGCSCRIDAGTVGVMGPKNAFSRISFFALPLAMSRTFFACIIDPIPMVIA